MRQFEIHPQNISFRLGTYVAGHSLKNAPLHFYKTKHCIEIILSLLALLNLGCTPTPRQTCHIGPFCGQRLKPDFVAFLLSRQPALPHFCKKQIVIKAILILGMLLSICCTMPNKKFDTPMFLSGTWKVENKENYEAWTATDATTLEGQGYKIRGGQKTVTEYLRIKTGNGRTVYTATVPGQNSGQPVGFVLNPEVTGKYSFENAAHDFPKKIQYTPKGSDSVWVAVLGDGGKGFSYWMVRQ
jgi:hypothetical protein